MSSGTGAGVGAAGTPRGAARGSAARRRFRFRCFFGPRARLRGPDSRPEPPAAAAAAAGAAAGLALLRLLRRRQQRNSSSGSSHSSSSFLRIFGVSGYSPPPRSSVAVFSFSYFPYRPPRGARGHRRGSSGLLVAPGQARAGHTKQSGDSCRGLGADAAVVGRDLRRAGRRGGQRGDAECGDWRRGREEDAAEAAADVFRSPYLEF